MALGDKWKKRRMEKFADDLGYEVTPQDSLPKAPDVGGPRKEWVVRDESAPDYTGGSAEEVIEKYTNRPEDAGTYEGMRNIIRDLSPYLPPVTAVDLILTTQESGWKEALKYGGGLAAGYLTVRGVGSNTAQSVVKNLKTKLVNMFTKARTGDPRHKKAMDELGKIILRPDTRDPNASKRISNWMQKYKIIDPTGTGRTTVKNIDKGAFRSMQEADKFNIPGITPVNVGRSGKAIDRAFKDMITKTSPTLKENVGIAADAYRKARLGMTRAPLGRGRTGWGVEKEFFKDRAKNLGRGLGIGSDVKLAVPKIGTPENLSELRQILKETATVGVGGTLYDKYMRNRQPDNTIQVELRGGSPKKEQTDY